MRSTGQIDAKTLLTLRETVSKNRSFVDVLRVVQWIVDGKPAGTPKLERRTLHVESGRGTAKGLDLEDLRLVLDSSEAILAALGQV